MTAELVRGQNHPLPGTRMEIRVTAGTPVVAAATLNDAQGRIRGAEWTAHPAAPRLPGVEVSRRAAPVHHLALDPGALPQGVERVSILLALPAGPGAPPGFAGLPAPFLAVTGPDGTELASYTVTGLATESAVVALELYLRRGAWKVRAVGQGYADGLAALFADQGLAEAHTLAAAVQEAVTAGADDAVAPPQQSPAPHAAASRGAAGGASAGGPVDYRHPRRAPAATGAAPPAPGPGTGEDAGAQPVAGDAAGWSLEERLHNQVWGIFEDLARSVAAYRSAVDFADARRERELDGVLADPQARVGAAAAEARARAEARHSTLVEQARAVLERDAAQLEAEAEVVEPALPPAMARWDNPVWHAYRPPTERPLALRVGDVSLPERAGLRVPLLVRLPLERGLWIDSGRPRSREAGAADADELRHLARTTAAALAARVLAVHPPGEVTLRIIDPAGAAATALLPLVESGVLADPPAAGASGVARTLERLTQRVDLVRMAVRSGATDALPPDLDLADQLLVVHDFPHGFDDRAVNQLRYLADEGPAVGVSLLLVADRDEARGFGPLLDPLWRSLLRLTPVPDDHLADPWVGHAWTYEPLRVPAGSRVVPQVLRHAAAARRTAGG
ncbi:phosphonate metabolism protein [Streptomyces qinglanensis]|uniref:Phosphonate metabolism protein n=1 Tax=Streptomyces qinglanensis TaxID=943816 RepID=A0A1E7K2Z6_9ACTN|nr:TerD family protein [Streptomyces qinglanensis]OEU98302.1 phosphonate metabolism protein [Streptomyces qinglanensis]